MGDAKAGVEGEGVAGDQCLGFGECKQVVQDGVDGALWFAAAVGLVQYGAKAFGSQTYEDRGTRVWIHEGVALHLRHRFALVI